MKFKSRYPVSCLIFYDLFKQFCLVVRLDKSQKIGKFDKFHCPGPLRVMMMGSFKLLEDGGI